ncbi:MAG: UPF0104 family protein [Oscillochloris sp.]|nr:UPF0104 family protein [Oscillochloris sp.]
MDSGTVSDRLSAGPRALIRSPWFRLTVVVIVLAAWGWFLFRQLDTLRSYGWQINPAAFGGAIALGALYFAGLAVCWTMLLRTFGDAARAVSLPAGAGIWLGTMLSRYVPGNVWHILGRLAFAGQLGVSRTHVLASATVEQVLTLLGALSVFGLSLPFWRGGDDTLWLLLMIPIGLVLLHPRVLGTALSWAAERLRRPELAWNYRYGELLGVLLAYALANTVAGLALIVVIAGLGAPNIPLAPLIGAANLAWVLGYLSFLTPSGLGVREAALTALLAAFVPLPVAIVAGLVHRLALTMGELLAAGIALWFTRLQNLHPHS